ncbi:MAG: hypothetical protein M1816_007277 [Peltula sp. TS41687]|nr:MAG: hypothetical protein M1816_007277 [Peltula sp. TS41687]
MLEVQPDDHRHLQDIADVLAKSKKVIVVTGAGISTNCGIPDFRSEDGLYSLIQSHYDTAVSNAPAGRETDAEEWVPSSQSSSKAISGGQSKLPCNLKGQDLFDARIWNDSVTTSVFYRFMACLRKKVIEDVSRTTSTHKFLRTLREGGRLVRCYTQNIDGLEERDGLCTDLNRGKGSRARFSRKILAKPRPEGPIVPGSGLDGGCEVVQLHGDLKFLRCSLCHWLSSWEDGEHEATMLGGEAPGCQSCLSKAEKRLSQGRRGTAVGRLRPNVVLYGEEHPNTQDLSTIITHDLGLKPDVLLIMGTSMRVHGLKTVVRELAKAVHASGRGKGRVIFVNRTKPSDSVWSGVIDYWVEMDCDAWVGNLKDRRGDLWERQGMLKLAIGKKTSRKEKTKPTTKKIGDPEGECESDKENLVDTSRREKGVSSKKTSGRLEAEVESDKENIISTPTKVKTFQYNTEATTRPKPRARKTISTGSAVSQLHSLSSDDIKNSQREETTIQPITPSNSTRRRQASLLKAQQLPTPPASGRSQHPGIKSFKRSQALLEHDISSETPSKRKKLVEVWVDPEDELNAETRY